MTLRLFNTLTKTKDVFAPLDAKNVRLYVCGPTVYDFAHIGNARPVIVFDVLFRLLRHTYGDAHVRYVRNITDVDDKINARAAERGISIRALTEETARIYEEDVAALGNLPPTVTPRATEHIDQMIAMIGQLIESGHAYEAGGHVLFDVSSKPDYGKLSRRSLDEMIAGARVEVAPYKKNAMDFVLWKPSDASQPGWNSPWGRGRPGWHIECSAMAGEYLGETFDIHGGGIDLQFPHHENEIAQSEGAHCGHPLATVWMHNGFLQVEGEKMAKSAGNFFTIRELLADWPGEVLRLNMLRTHYRQPIDWTIKSLEESSRILRDWIALAVPMKLAGPANEVPDRPLYPPVLDALSDDLNTPKAIAEIHALRNSIVHDLGDTATVALSDTLRFFGLLNDEVTEAFARRRAGSVDEEKVGTLIAARAAARRAKNFAESDRIRDELAAMGIVLKDGKDAKTGEPTTTWELRA